MTCEGPVEKPVEALASTTFSNPGARKAVMYCEAARWSAFSIRLFWKITGCGELMMASRLSLGSPLSAAAQAMAPPQS